MSRLVPFLLVLLCACDTAVTSPPETFRILELSPREQLTTESKSVTVRLDVDPRFLVDYGEQSVRMIERPVLEIGSRTEVPLETYLGHGQFQGTVGPGLEIGLHEIRVKLGDGREASLPAAYEVRAPDEPEPVLGYWVESISDQYVKERFTVIIHAAGTNAQHFDGRVTVKLYSGGVPTGVALETGRFSAGLGQQELFIDTAGDNYLVVVQDDQGNGATSNAFRVLPRD